MNKNEFDKIPEKDRLNRILEGTSFFASVHQPNYSAHKKFKADPEFIINLGLEGAELEKAKSWGLKIREADASIPMPHVRIKRKVKAGKTPDEVKPQVVDSMQNRVPPTIMIGNKSKVIVKFGTYWADTGGGGVHTTLFKVQIRELVAFDTTRDRSLVTDETGFKVPEQAVAANVAQFDDDDGFEAPKEQKVE